MEPGNTHKKDIVFASERSSLNRLPIGEKGIGRFGVHKLGKKIEMITRSANEQEVYVSIDWNSFANAKYLEDVHVIIEERTPEFFTGDRTGTKLYISDLSACWSRGMLRNVIEKKIRPQSGEPDYIFSLSPVEFDNKSWYIAFNVNQMFALQMDELVDENLMCSLTGSYITSLKQRSASCVSKQGIGVFSAGH